LYANYREEDTPDDYIGVLVLAVQDEEVWVQVVAGIPENLLQWKTDRLPVITVLPKDDWRNWLFYTCADQQKHHQLLRDAANGIKPKIGTGPGLSFTEEKAFSILPLR
jgi:hypothetical protein